jgi:ATP-dependent Clp protease protease subunit
MGGVEGQVRDVEIQTKEMLRIKNQVNTILSKHTGQQMKKIETDTDRDFFMTPTEAKEYGVIDNIITLE